jgi:FkbM family methyltransferase
MNWRSSLAEAQGLWRTAAAMELLPADRMKYGLAYYLSRPGLVKIAPAHLVVRVTRSARTMEAVLRPNGSDHHTLADMFQRQLYAVDATDVRRVLDLGANIGLSTLFFASLFPDAEFACVEPSPENCRILRAVLMRNQIRATVVEAAIGPEAGQVELHLTSDPTSFSIVPSIAMDRRVVVPQVTVTDVLRQLEWAEIDLLKIDIEGYEQILFGRENAWLHRVRRIVGEAHGHVNYGIDHVRADLAPFGFKVTCKSYDARYALTVFEASRQYQ